MIKQLLLGVVALCASLYVNDYATIKYNNVSFKELHREVQREIECLAINIYRESGFEPISGQIAVAFVTINRMLSPEFPKSVCSVVYQRDRRVCQFSWTCMTSLSKINRERYEYIKELAKHVYLNHHKIDDPSLGATFYHADYVFPRWKLEKTTKIGRHIFYKM